MDLYLIYNHNFGSSPTVSFYLNRFGNKYNKSIVDNKINFDGEKILTGLNIHERIKNKNVLVKKAKGKDGQGTGLIVIRDIEKEFKFKYEMLSSNFIS